MVQTMAEELATAKAELIQTRVMLRQREKELQQAREDRIRLNVRLSEVTQESQRQTEKLLTEIASLRNQIVKTPRSAAVSATADELENMRLELQELRNGVVEQDQILCRAAEVEKQVAGLQDQLEFLTQQATQLRKERDDFHKREQQTRAALQQMETLFRKASRERDELILVNNHNSQQRAATSNVENSRGTRGDAAFNSSQPLRSSSSLGMGGSMDSNNNPSGGVSVDLVTSNSHHHHHQQQHQQQQQHAHHPSQTQHYSLRGSSGDPSFRIHNNNDNSSNHQIQKPPSVPLPNQRNALPQQQHHHPHCFRWTERGWKEVAKEDVRSFAMDGAIPTATPLRSSLDGLKTSSSSSIAVARRIEYKGDLQHNNFGDRYQQQQQQQQQQRLSVSSLSPSKPLHSGESISVVGSISSSPANGTRFVFSEPNRLLMSAPHNTFHYPAASPASTSSQQHQQQQRTQPSSLSLVPVANTQQHKNHNNNENDLNVESVVESLFTKVASLFSVPSTSPVAPATTSPMTEREKKKQRELEEAKRRDEEWKKHQRLQQQVANRLSLRGVGGVGGGGVSSTNNNNSNNSGYLHGRVYDDQNDTFWVHEKYRSTDPILFA